MSATRWIPELRRRAHERAAAVPAATMYVAVAIAGLCIVSVVIATLVVRAGQSGGSGARTEAPVTSIPIATTQTTQRVAVVVVHASGGVRSPGVYRLPVGSRVVDLLDRAGGPSDDIDLERVNLAAALVDGQRIWLPRRGEPAPSVAEGSAQPGGSSSVASGPVDINHASVDQLESLPGVGPATAAAIVSQREKNGPFRSVDDLTQVRGIGVSKIEAIRDLVVCG